MVRFVMPHAKSVAAPTPPPPLLFGQETGDTVAISVNDIHQGQLGDCFLLSAIGEIALNSPSTIMSMIHANADGTETVTLHGDARGHLPVTLGAPAATLTETVTNVFDSRAVNNGAGQDVVGGQKEIWAQVMEKAYAQAGGGYASIANGGSPVLALEALTGHAASFQSGASLTIAQLTADVGSHDLIVMDTGAGKLGYGLVQDHAYMFEGVQRVGGVAEIKLGNPWGFNQPGLIPLSQLGHNIAEVDVGHLA